MSKSQNQADAVVITVIRQIAAVTGYDPACLSPDYSLKKDLELTQNEIRQIIDGAVKSLAIEIGQVVDWDFDDLTLRELVDELKRCGASQQRSAA